MSNRADGCLPFEDDDVVGMMSGFLSIAEESEAWLRLSDPVMQSSIPRCRGICVVSVMSNSDEGECPIVEFPLLLMSCAVTEPFLSLLPEN